MPLKVGILGRGIGLHLATLLATLLLGADGLSVTPEVAVAVAVAVAYVATMLLPVPAAGQPDAVPGPPSGATT